MCRKRHIWCKTWFQVTYRSYLLTGIVYDFTSLLISYTFIIVTHYNSYYTDSSQRMVSWLCVQKLRGCLDWLMIYMIVRFR